MNEIIKGAYIYYLNVHDVVIDSAAFGFAIIGDRDMSKFFIDEHKKANYRSDDEVRV